jgi:hypothetical protein
VKKQSVLPRFIIILGTTESGSTAVYEYLAGRGDLNDPFMNSDYQLPHVPNGLMSLEAASEKAFHPGTADFALTQFENLVNRLSRSYSVWHTGKGFSKKLKLFEIATKDFIEEICAVNYPMHLEWRRLMRSPTQHFINLLKNRLQINEEVPNTRILVSQQKLVAAAKKMHNKIFQTDSLTRPVILDQAGSGWNPIESTKYFSNRKVILVTRDPRDQFVFIKKNKKGYSVEGFIDWYLELQRRLKNINDSVLINIRFEDFVINNKKMIDLICNHVSIDSNILSSYEPNLSKKNINIYQEFLSKEEIYKIEYSLSDYIDKK